MPCVEVIQDCQFGSTGKGLFAGFLANAHQPDVLAMAPSPNAGHTLVMPNGKRFIHRMLPLGFQSPKLKHIVLGPGSLIDLNALLDELYALKDFGHLDITFQIDIHKNAAVVLDRHREAEANGGTAPGSTRKGVGAAQANRVLRNPQQINIISAIPQDHAVFSHVRLIDTAQMQRIYMEADTIQVEGCQGYSLSVYHGDYPHVTCRDVTVYSLLADCGIPVCSQRQLRVYGVFRTYPIRVANRPASGEWSGPTYPDSHEITFESLGRPQELTTVTQLPRRIFTFSQQQAIEACVQNRVDFAFLNFCNYPPSWKELKDIWLRLSESAMVRYVGFGPRLSDVFRIGAPGMADAHLQEIYDNYRRTAE